MANKDVSGCEKDGRKPLGVSAGKAIVAACSAASVQFGVGNIVLKSYETGPLYDLDELLRAPMVLADQRTGMVLMNPEHCNAQKERGQCKPDCAGCFPRPLRGEASKFPLNLVRTVSVDFINLHVTVEMRASRERSGDQVTWEVHAISGSGRLGHLNCPSMTRIGCDRKTATNGS